MVLLANINSQEYICQCKFHLTNLILHVGFAHLRNLEVFTHSPIILVLFNRRAGVFYQV